MNYSNKLKKNCKNKRNTKNCKSKNRRNTKNCKSKNRRNTKNLRNRTKSIKYGGMEGNTTTDNINYDAELNPIDKEKAYWEAFAAVMMENPEYIDSMSVPAPVSVNNDIKLLELYKHILTVDECKDFLSCPLMRNEFIRIYNKKTLLLKTYTINQKGYRNVHKYARWWSYNDFIIVFLYAYKILGRFMPDTISDGEKQVIVSIGESPFKLCFAMNCFFNDQNDHTMNGRVITFPISTLRFICSQCLNPHWGVDISDALGSTELSWYDPFMKKIINTMIYPDYNGILIPLYNRKPLEPLDINKCYNNFINNTNNKFAKIKINGMFIHKHFRNYNISPSQIIDSNLRHKFIDRSESTESIDMLLFVYKYLIELEELDIDRKKQFLDKFHIICFDGTYDVINTIQNKVRFMRYIVWALFPELTLDYQQLKKIVTYEDIFIGIGTRTRGDVSLHLNAMYKSSKLKINKEQEGPLRELRETLTSNKMIDNLSAPEFTYCLNRCVKSIGIHRIDKNTDIKNDVSRKDVMFTEDLKPSHQQRDRDEENRMPFDFCNLDLLMMVNIYYQNNIYNQILPIIRNSIRIKEWMIDPCLPSLFFYDFQEKEFEKSTKKYILDFIVATHFNFINTERKEDWFDPDLMRQYTTRSKEDPDLNNRILLTSKWSIFSDSAICGNYTNITNLNDSALEPSVFNYNGLTIQDGQYYQIKPTILLLDLDETLGQFNIQFHMVYKYAKKLIKTEVFKSQFLDISRELLPYLVRSDFPIFINCLERLLQTNALFKIYITTNNNAREYILDLVHNLQIIFIGYIIIPPENIITGMVPKDISSFSEMGNVYIIDDKANRVKKTSVQYAINIPPVFNYIPYTMINEMLKPYGTKVPIDEEQDMKDPVLQRDYYYVMNKENTGDLQKLMQQTKRTCSPQKYNDNNDLMKILIKHFSSLQGWNTGKIFNIEIDNIIEQVCESKNYSIDIKKIRATIGSITNVERDKGQSHDTRHDLSQVSSHDPVSCLIS